MIQKRRDRALTKANSGQVSEMDVALASQRMQRASHAIAVEADEHADNEQHGACCPTQEGHDQERVTQNESVVKAGNQIEADLPRVICMQVHHITHRLVRLLLVWLLEYSTACCMISNYMQDSKHLMEDKILSHCSVRLQMLSESGSTYLTLNHV